MVKDISITISDYYHSVYYPGSIVRGKVVITVDKPKKYKNIAIGLYGAAHVRWTEGEKNEVCRTNHIQYVREESVVWSLENSPTNNLPIGEYTFPFEFRLPQNIPHSFEGRIGRVNYQVGVTVSRIGLLKHDFQTTHVITVKKRSDILSLFQNPKTVTTVKKLSLFWHKLGSITATCDLPRTGFSPGESIPYTMHVRNESSRNIHIKCALLREDKFIASTGQQRKTLTEITKVISPVIRAGEIQSFSCNLTIPTQAFATLLLQDCSCISVEYDIIITVKIPWSINKKMGIPLMIADRHPGQEPVQFDMQLQQALSHNMHNDFSFHHDFSNMTKEERTEPSLPTYYEACHRAGAFN